MNNIVQDFELTTNSKSFDSIATFRWFKLPVGLFILFLEAMEVTPGLSKGSALRDNLIFTPHWPPPGAFSYVHRFASVRTIPSPTTRRISKK